MPLSDIRKGPLNEGSMSRGNSLRSVNENCITSPNNYYQDRHSRDSEIQKNKMLRYENTQLKWKNYHSARTALEYNSILLFWLKFFIVLNIVTIFLSIIYYHYAPRIKTCCNKERGICYKSISFIWWLFKALIVVGLLCCCAMFMMKQAFSKCPTSVSENTLEGFFCGRIAEPSCAYIDSLMKLIRGLKIVTMFEKEFCSDPTKAACEAVFPFWNI